MNSVCVKLNNFQVTFAFACKQISSAEGFEYDLTLTKRSFKLQSTVIAHGVRTQFLRMDGCLGAIKCLGSAEKHVLTITTSMSSMVQ